MAQGPEAPDAGTLGGGELTPGVQGGEADLPSQPLRNRRRGNLIRAAGELEELQSESKLNRGCGYCGWWHPNSPFPFPSCNLWCEAFVSPRKVLPSKAAESEQTLYAVLVWRRL